MSWKYKGDCAGLEKRTREDMRGHERHSEAVVDPVGSMY